MSDTQTGESGTLLDRQRCQVGGLNSNYTSSSRTLYHIQIEDRGPVLDRLTEVEVRRVNVIVYANYGEPNARIIYGQDQDFPDIRTAEHNQFIQTQIQELATATRRAIEEKENRQIDRIKGLIREYYITKHEALKREFEEANALYPFLFSRAWSELKSERTSEREPEPVAVDEASDLVEEPIGDVLYPLDAGLREKVIEIERLIIDLGQDLQRLKARGSVDDILLQTCRKLVTRAKESLAGSDSEFNERRLEMTRNSLLTTWRQVKSRLKGPTA